jgi:hypothetical protein
VSFYRSVAASVSWRRVGIAEGYAIVLLLREWLGLEGGARFSRDFAIEVFSILLAAILVLVAMGIADEAVRRGARRVLSFGVTVVAASLLSALIFTSLSFDMTWRSQRSLTLFIVENAMQTALWASLAIIVLYNSVQTARIRQGVKDAQMKRVQKERQVLEARLDAVRKQVDAPALFQELTEIRDGLFREDPQSAEALERLIQRLRGARVATSTSQISRGAI